jgi:3-deoxy-D-manno-octulosonic-acid transferase
MLTIYTLLLYIIQPLIWLRLLLRSLKAPNYRKRWLERYGFCKNKVLPNGILIHSVSVGETIAAIPLIKQLQQRYPDLPITVTTMTPTGSERVTTLLGDSVSHVYLPYDLPGAIQRFLRTLKPKLAIVMETELWPNFITGLHRNNIPLIIANARLSERSAKGYAKFGKFTHSILEKITLIAAQNQQDGHRFVQLGLPASHLAVTGSIKFDISLTDAQIAHIEHLKREWQLTRPVWIAASTHNGEDEIILHAYQQICISHPELLLILVPRHPERFNKVEKLVASMGFRYQLRSQNQIPSLQTQVIIGDTMGELLQLYSLANIAFVGGSLIEHGGHNPLEPALHRLPVMVGQHTFNFRAISQQLAEAGGLRVVSDQPQELARQVTQLLDNKDHAISMGKKAYQVLKQNQGALNRLLELIEHYIPHE